MKQKKQGRDKVIGDELKSTKMIIDGRGTIYFFKKKTYNNEENYDNDYHN